MGRTFAIAFLFFATTFAAAKDRLICSDKDLLRQDCHLISGTYDVRVLSKTVAWGDGTWHAVSEMPMKGDAVAWEKVSLASMGGRPILQFWLWDKGVGETHIQTLHWFVGTIAKQNFSLLAEGLVRRRRPESADPATPAKTKPKFLYDNWETYGLKVMKNGDLEWQVGGQKKTLEKNPVKKQVQNGV